MTTQLSQNEDFKCIRELVKVILTIICLSLLSSTLLTEERYRQGSRDQGKYLCQIILIMLFIRYVCL